MTGTEAALEQLALVGNRMPPDDLPRHVAETAALLGGTDVVLYLVDLEQRLLRPLVPPDGEAGPDLPVDGPHAGRAFREERPVEEPVEGGRRLWLPVLDSAERFGVIGLTDDGSTPERRWMAFASLCGELVTSKAAYGDRFEQRRRLRPLSLAAEMRWAVLPPLTFVSPDVTVTGILEPAYDIAGDAFDYAVNGDTAHVAVFDAMGHGLEASRIANLAVGSYRNSRRNGLGLGDTVRAMDQVVTAQFGDARFATVQVATLDLTDGTLRVVNAGHPPLLRFRAGEPPHELVVPPCRPVGLGSDPAAETVFTLEPGDWVVLHTDGITEAVGPSGAAFGEERLAADLDRLLGEGHRPAEVLRLLIQDVLAYGSTPPRDDGSLVLVGWKVE